ncbi:hypothetical protein JW962_02685 [Candidatus Dojkabacteria bacterium]|nr:hypothetical protein [Candidatus Dojkabacteria bacterium]
MEIFTLMSGNPKFSVFTMLTSMVIAFIVSTIFAPLLIKLLYKLQFTVQHRMMKDKSNEEFIKIHGHKTGTPGMGGILIWTVVPIVTLILFGFTPLTIAFSASFGVWGFLGFIDGAMVMLKKADLKFRQFQESFGWRMGKLALMYIVSLIVSYLLVSYLGISTISIAGYILNLSVWILVPALAFLMLAGVYAFEITDGLDGLLAGLTIRSFIALTILLLAQGNFEILPLLGVMLGTLFVYLYFNIPPARFFMGGPGAMPLGAIFLFLAIYTGNLIPYFFMSIVMWVDMASSFIQIFAIRFLKRRIFRIAPLHHHFEAKGWPEHKVTMRFWLIHQILCFVGILVGLMV